MRAAFPYQLLSQDVVPRFLGASLEAQQSISGAETVVPTLGGRWEVTCSFVIRGEGAQLAWQAFLAQMEGRFGTTLVPVITRFRPRTRDGRMATCATVAGLADAQTHEHFGIASAPLYAFTVDAAPLRATDLRITPTVHFLPIRPGQFFSIGERLYRVQLHWEDAAGHMIRVQPPLREAVSAGAGAVVNRPVCLMRMVSEMEGELDHLLDRLPRVTCTFVEAA